MDFHDAALAATEVEKEVKINACFRLKHTPCALGPRMFVSIKDLCAVRSSKHVYFSLRISILIWLFGVSARFRKPDSSSHWRNWHRFWLSCTGFIFHPPNLLLLQGSFLDWGKNKADAFSGRLFWGAGWLAAKFFLWFELRAPGCLSGRDCYHMSYSEPYKCLPQVFFVKSADTGKWYCRYSHL